MRIIETRVYTFDELNDAAKQRAREWYRSSGEGDNFWSECVIDGAKAFGTHMGFAIANIYWSGFCSQGDGACFIGAWAAANVNARELDADAPPDEALHAICAALADAAARCPTAHLSITQTGRYSHSGSMKFDGEFESEFDGDPALIIAAREAQGAAEQAARDFADWIYNRLSEAYDWQNADEQVDVGIIAHELEFTAAGRVV